MDKIIKIFEKTVGEQSTVELYPAVEVVLTTKEYEDLLEYFVDNVSINDTYKFEESFTFDLLNTNELLENSPLPDGTIVKLDKFTENGEYIVVLGDFRKDLKAVIKLWNHVIYLGK